MQTITKFAVFCGQRSLVILRYLISLRRKAAITNFKQFQVFAIFHVDEITAAESKLS